MRAFMANKAGSSDLWVCNCCHAVQAVAFSSLGLFNSIGPSGRPLMNSAMSGRRWWLFSTTVDWLAASQSLSAGHSKSMTSA